jgi:transposase-like protein
MAAKAFFRKAFKENGRPDKVTVAQLLPAKAGRLVNACKAN